MFCRHTEYFEKVYRRNSVLSNIRSGSSHSNRNKLMQCSSFKIQPRQEFRINVETIELVGGTPGIDDYTAGRISVKTCSEIQ